MPLLTTLASDEDDAGAIDVRVVGERLVESAIRVVAEELVGMRIVDERLRGMGLANEALT